MGARRETLGDRPASEHARANPERKFVSASVCVCVRASPMADLSKERKQCQTQGRRGENWISFFFSFAQHWRDWATREARNPNPQSSRASAPIVAHAVKMILDLGRRSVVLAASHVIALGRLILPSFVSLVQSLSPAPVHSHRSLGSRQLSRTSCHLAVVPRSPILST